MSTGLGRRSYVRHADSLANGSNGLYQYKTTLISMSTRFGKTKEVTPYWITHRVSVTRIRVRIGRDTVLTFDVKNDATAVWRLCCLHSLGIMSVLVKTCILKFHYPGKGPHPHNFYLQNKNNYYACQCIPRIRKKCIEVNERSFSLKDTYCNIRRCWFQLVPVFLRLAALVYYGWSGVCLA